MPEAIALSPEDRARVQSTFDQMAESIAAFEASPEVNLFPRNSIPSLLAMPSSPKPSVAATSYSTVGRNARTAMSISVKTVNEAWKALAPEFDGRFRVPTLRNVDKRPRSDFVKAYGHNGYFKSLKEIVHFYNSEMCCRNAKVVRQGKGLVPAPPETSQNLNPTCCNLGLSDQQENDLVAFLKTLTDGYAK